MHRDQPVGGGFAPVQASTAAVIGETRLVHRLVRRSGLEQDRISLNQADPILFRFK
jgi:hypothetical protein